MSSFERGSRSASSLVSSSGERRMRAASSSTVFSASFARSSELPCTAKHGDEGAGRRLRSALQREFAQNLGFGPPPPGAQPVPPPQLEVRIDGRTPEAYLKHEASSMICGWIIGGVILLLLLLTFAGVGIYAYMQAREATSAATAAPKVAGTWDGRSTFERKGNDAVTLTGVTATVSDTAIRASGNCQLSLVDVKLTAPIGIDASANANANANANAKVTMTGGSITSSTNAIVASAASNVTLVGTHVTGKSKKSGAAKITGAP